MKIELDDIPRFPRGLGPGLSASPLATSFWFPAESVAKQAREGSGLSYRSGRIWLGRTASEGAEPVGWIDDRHMVTVAGSRTGKGVSSIIPALCEYPGSVICLDPKGENAARTAARRGFGDSGLLGLHQDVYVLDPYGISGVEAAYQASFDPLEGLGPDVEGSLEQATLIAEALVVTTSAKDAHWDEYAQALIEALILHVVSWPAYKGDRTLGRVRTLLRSGDRDELERLRAHIVEQAEPDPEMRAKLKSITAFEVLLQTMEANDAFDGVISGMASGLKDLGPRERGSILSTARRNLKFLDSPRMRACLQPSEHSLQLETLKRAPKGATVYVVLPARLMKTHARWMRLILNLTIGRLESEGGQPRCGHPVLAILDEFPTLGHLPVLETAIGYMAGFGLKLWAILQDLSQLKRSYPESWETFLGNAGLLQFFGNADPTTLEFIAKRLGDIEVLRETASTSESETVTVSDISDFDKLHRVSGGRGLGKFLGSFALENNTESSSKSVAGSESRTRIVQRTQLMTPDEIRRYFSRDSGLQIIALADYRPLFLRRTAYFQDPQFAGKYSNLSGELPEPRKAADTTSRTRS